MSSSVIAIGIAVWVLRSGIRKIKGGSSDDGEEAVDNNNATQIVPVQEAMEDAQSEAEEEGEMEEEEVISVGADQSESEDVDNTNTASSQSYLTERRRSSVSRVRSARSEIVHNIHEEHRLSQAGLQQNIEIKQRKQRRRTQLRLDARKKLKKQKILSKIPAFSMLKEAEIDAMINAMTHESHLHNAILCTQGEIATKFYVVMKGECGAYISLSKAGSADRKVGKIKVYSFFGENALLSSSEGEGGGGGDGVNEFRNATVKVESQNVSLLVLTKDDFLNRSVLEGVKQS